MKRFTTSGQDQKGPRLFVREALADGSVIHADRGQAHYLRDVLRLKSNSTVLLFNGKNGEWLARLEEDGRKGARLVVESQNRAQSMAPDLWFLFAPIKRGRIDYMVQKATELGASAIQPVQTAFTNQTRFKAERLEANIIEAAEQCGVLNIPELLPMQKLEKVLKGWDPARRIMYCDENAQIANPVDALGKIEKGPLAVLIGPEGGFSEQERVQLSAHDFVTSISLGPRLLRADTAGVAALTLVQAVLGDWQAVK